ncbi:MAG: hypothetical protein U9N04_01900 [Patescibacteria group bacterium]|nr:hypothetical protein [Patescibacteria group bacterium]
MATTISTQPPTTQPDNTEISRVVETFGNREFSTITENREGRIATVKQITSQEKLGGRPSRQIELS